MKSKTRSPEARRGGARPSCLWGIALLAVASALAAPGQEKKAPAAPPSHWTHIEAATGAMNLDGTLRLVFPLGESTALKQLGLRLELEHQVETGADGRARSNWRVRSLQSSLVPSGHAQLRWQPPGGAPVMFAQAGIGRALSAAGSSRWLIRESAAGEYEIRSRDGWGWRYRQGTLAGADHPALGPLRFSTQGAWIGRIETSGGPPLLQAGYDESGRLVTLQLAGGKEQRFLWDAAGHLVAWQGADGREVKFGYRDDLLAEVMEPDRPVRPLAWRANPGAGRGDSRWATPVHVAADGTDTYTYQLTSRGYVLTRRESGTGQEVITLFNPRRRRLEQRAGEETVVVTFRRGTGGRGALERIVSGRGEVLEDYRYDERGQLVALKRAGEPERFLTYDKSGRLMGLEERLLSPEK